MELSKEIIKILEENEITVSGEISERSDKKGQYDIELQFYSRAGEDFIIPLIYDGSRDDFILQFCAYAADFDPEEHAALWIEYRGKNGVPESIKELLEDAKWIDRKLKTLDGLLVGLKNDTIPVTVMGREEFYNYIIGKFNIIGEAARLIHNILLFVESNFEDECDQLEALTDLLDGTIGLSEEEIKMVRL